MKLIGSLTSPYVRKVRVVMAEKKLDYQLVLEDVFASDAMLKYNPLGKVPCLVMDRGVWSTWGMLKATFSDTAWTCPQNRLLPLLIVTRHHSTEQRWSPMPMALSRRSEYSTAWVGDTPTSATTASAWTIGMTSTATSRP